MGLYEYRNRFAVVSQDPYLFQTSIEGNLDLSQNAERSMIEYACRQSGANEFIKELADGFSYQIGKNGSKLSGGEKQKIAMARAFVKDANIVILDEATSNYDVKSEAYIHKIITEKLVGKTVIHITHNYQNLKDMDKIFLLENGTLRQVEFCDL